MKTNQTFGAALEALREGKRVTRFAPEDGIFIFRQVPATISIETVPKMQSLPDAVKAEFLRRHQNPASIKISVPDMEQPAVGQYNNIYYDNQLAVVDAYNQISGYSPTVDDALATDWTILD